LLERSTKHKTQNTNPNGLPNQDREILGRRATQTKAKTKEEEGGRSD
jgi:hypothetical protein